MVGFFIIKCLVLTISDINLAYLRDRDVEVNMSHLVLLYVA